MLLNSKSKVTLSIKVKHPDLGVRPPGIKSQLSFLPPSKSLHVSRPYFSQLRNERLIVLTQKIIISIKYILPKRFLFFKLFVMVWGNTLTFYGGDGI